MCSFKSSLDIGKQRTNELEKKSKKIMWSAVNN